MICQCSKWSILKRIETYNAIWIEKEHFFMFKTMNNIFKKMEKKLKKIGKDQQKDWKRSKRSRKCKKILKKWKKIEKSPEIAIFWNPQ